MLLDVYAPPLPSSAGLWCTRAFIARGIRPEVPDTNRVAFVRIFNPQSSLTAIRLKSGQGRIMNVQWAEAGVLYPRSAGPAILINIQLPNEAKPKSLSFEAIIGKRIDTITIQQTVDIDYDYSNLSKPIPVDKHPRIRVAHTGKWQEKPWDGWFLKGGTYAVQESRKVGNSLWNIGLLPATNK